MVEPLEDFVLRLGFDDGAVREIDREAELWGPVFEPLRDDPLLLRRQSGDALILNADCPADRAP